VHAEISVDKSLDQPGRQGGLGSGKLQDLLADKVHGDAAGVLAEKLLQVMMNRVVRDESFVVVGLHSDLPDGYRSRVWCLPVELFVP